MWIHDVCSCPQAKDTEVRGTKFVVAGLTEGGLYGFRVSAVNAAGPGEPGLVTELIELRDRTSKIQGFHSRPELSSHRAYIFNL